MKSPPRDDVGAIAYGMTLEPLLAGGELHPRGSGQIPDGFESRDPQRRRPRRR